MKILIVEDDPLIADLEKDYLEDAGYEVEIALDGWEGKRLAETGSFDAVILDVMLPGLNGYIICREIRKTQDIPVLLVTAKMEEEDKLKGLGLGADDYIVKPFSPTELVARLKAHIAIHERLLATQGKTVSRCIRLRDLEIYPDANRVVKSGREIPMPNKEFQMLSFLAQNPNIVYSKEYLLEKIWGYDTNSDTATVMVHVNRIREKIEDNPSHPEILQTVWGAGYKLVI